MSVRATPTWALRVFVTTGLIGIALAVADPGMLAPALTVGSLGAVIYFLHRLGRSGPDAPWKPGAP